MVIQIMHADWGCLSGIPSSFRVLLCIPYIDFKTHMQERDICLTWNMKCMLREISNFMTFDGFVLKSWLFSSFEMNYYLCFHSFIPLARWNMICVWVEGLGSRHFFCVENDHFFGESGHWNFPWDHPPAIHLF